MPWDLTVGAYSGSCDVSLFQRNDRILLSLVLWFCLHHFLIFSSLDREWYFGITAKLVSAVPCYERSNPFSPALSSNETVCIYI